MPTDIGQRLTKTFILVNSGDDPTLPLFCDDSVADCDFKIPVYANDGVDDLENDKSGFLILAQDWVSAITFTIQKWNGTAWINQDTITDATYGEFYAQGDFVNKPDYSGVVIYWFTILAAFGEGEYRVQAVETTPLGDQTTNTKSFCLKTFSCSPDNTVRLEWNMNNGFGDIDKDREVLDFGDTNFYFQVRLPMSFFGHPGSEYVREEIQYSNGMYEDITDVQTETYLLKIGSIPAWLHNTLKTYALESGTLLVTDYSSNNPQEFIQKAVRRTSDYKPRYKNSKCAPVTIEMQPQYNRLEKERCP